MSNYEQPEQTAFEREREAVQNQGKEALRKADAYVRENPVPVILGALAVGFIFGLLSRGIHHETPRSAFAARRDDVQDFLTELMRDASKRTRRAYDHSSHAVQDAVHDALGRVKDVDVEEYTDPVVKWFRRLWKKCC